MSTSSLPSADLKVVRSSPAAGLVGLVGRILIAGLFVVSGIEKILMPTMNIEYIRSMGLPLPEIAYIAAVCVEVAGGALLVLGWQTRWIALALAAFSVATAVVFHNALGDQNQLFHFLKNISIAGGLLQVAAFGAGRASLEGRR